ncbi:uncharacterized protein LOC121110555 [Gallus gallus]|uniref:uncharacterized protein LOC121110555 n=1 Tax=Gallus gallus TaxID=9031 RepID=UPI001F02EF73|nr:uncharacterized protein LOC121110555 [Gallus gallus]
MAGALRAAEREEDAARAGEGCPAPLSSQEAAVSGGEDARAIRPAPRPPPPLGRRAQVRPRTKFVLTAAPAEGARAARLRRGGVLRRRRRAPLTAAAEHRPPLSPEGCRSFSRRRLTPRSQLAPSFPADATAVCRHDSARPPERRRPRSRAPARPCAGGAGCWRAGREAPARARPGALRCARYHSKMIASKILPLEIISGRQGLWIVPGTGKLVQTHLLKNCPKNEYR